MAGRIPQPFIDDLLSRVNIVDVVDSRVRLKKAGKNHSACCPFHNEKTPSFTVSSDKQFYYCFGCGAKGNAIGFVMEFDNIDFPEAVDTLAGTVAMTVPKEEISPQQQQQQQERLSLYDLSNSAAEFYSQQLRFHESRQAPVSYLKKRGLSGKAAKFFNIGYAPPGWDNLKSALGGENGAEPEKLQGLKDAGLMIENDQGRRYDRFRNRVIYPIRDLRGRTIGFGARTLGDDKPKYLNSPETPIFNKGHELYGLYECRQIRQTLSRFLVVEGYMDVVALHEFGIHYAVATLGTATSETHLHKLFKIAPEIVFCFDGDEAGRRAAKRGLDLVLPILEDGQQIRFLFLPEGEDPDSMVRKEGKAGFEQRMKHALGISEFLLNSLKQDIDDPNSLDGRARLAKLAAPLLQQIPGKVLQALFWQALADATQIDSEQLKSLAISEPKIAMDQPPEHTPPPASLNTYPDQPYPDYEERDYGDDYGAMQHEQTANAPAAVKEHPLIRQAIALILHAPQVIPTFGELTFLQEFSGPHSLLLQRLVHILSASPVQQTLDALSLLATDADYQHYKQITETYNQTQGHLSQQQVANDCLNQLRIKAAKLMKSRIIKQSTTSGGFKHLPQQEQQLFKWASELLELDVLQQKLIRVGGKADQLNPKDQERLRQLDGQNS
ncbi:MAG: DNA primase [Bermanella sp.]